MSAADNLINEIAKEVMSLEEGPYGEVILTDPCREPLPPPDAFLAPEPDVLVPPVEPGLIERIAEERRLNGVYIPMQSPGEIILMRHNLRLHYWTLICHLQPRIPYLTKADLLAGLELVVRNTEHHERFHHASDVLRRLFGSPFHPLLEEALAVAWARRVLTQTRGVWNSKIGRMNGLLYRLLMQEVFAYASPGYCDWPLYADESRFQTALLDYLTPPDYRMLLSNGVELGELVIRMLENVAGGYVERVM